MIKKQPFGQTQHASSRILFGAAALAAMPENRADELLETLLEFGVNHIDTAAMYGASELRIARWMPAHRKDFFLATKTLGRTAETARADIEASLERLQVEQLDLIQFHNLVDEEGWRTAMSPGGALEGAVEARRQGLVRFIGVTGHGTYAAAMHLRSLQEYEFSSVLLPYSFTMMQSEDYAADFEALLSECQKRQVAVQTIKSVAARRWTEDAPARRFSWYEPIQDPAALQRAVSWVLDRAGIFLNTSSDARILRATLKAAAEHKAAGHPFERNHAIAVDVTKFGLEPLFVRGVSDQI